MYRGELPVTGSHCHAAPVLLMGLSGRFALHFAQGRTESCYSAWIDSGVEHVFAPCGEQVAYSVNAMRRPGMAPPGRGALAQATGLSESRFNHLFRAEMGVSFRSYRVWSQVRGALCALGTDSRLTQAALEGGFLDSSHFSHMFRKNFGMTPSSVLKPLRDVTLV